MLGSLDGDGLGLGGLIDGGLGHDIRFEGDLDRDLGHDLVGRRLVSVLLGDGLDGGGLIDGFDGLDLDEVGDLLGRGRLFGGADGLADGVLCDGVDVGGGGLVHGDGRGALLVSLCRGVLRLVGRLAPALLLCGQCGGLLRVDLLPGRAKARATRSGRHPSEVGRPCPVGLVRLLRRRSACASHGAGPGKARAYYHAPLSSHNEEGAVVACPSCPISPS